MRILKLLNKNLLYFFLFCLLISSVSNSNEPIDIWKLEDIKKNDNSELKVKIDKSNIDAPSNINLNSTSLVFIEEEEKIESNELKLVGLYDPAENDLNLNMWELSDGEKIIKLVEKIQKKNLSNDAQSIYKKLILTNACLLYTSDAADE